MFSLAKPLGLGAQDIPRKQTVVGNDVWIGARSIILAGVTIGDGAIIGAGSVVSRNVPPYSIVVGSPAKIVRKRFSDETIDGLLQIRWWEWPDEKIKKHLAEFRQPVDMFVDAHRF